MSGIELCAVFMCCDSSMNSLSVQPYMQPSHFFEHGDSQLGDEHIVLSCSDNKLTNKNQGGIKETHGFFQQLSPS
jgi:hypothetical protein